MLCSACQKCVRWVFIVFATVFLFVVTKSLALQLIGDATAKGAPVLCTGRHPDVQKFVGKWRWENVRNVTAFCLVLGASRHYLIRNVLGMC